MKTIIYSTVTNSTFIELQFKSIKKYFESEFEYIILDDSRDEEHLISYNIIQTGYIKNTCERLNIKYIRVPQELHKNRYLVLPEEWKWVPGENRYDDDACTRCALAVQYGFNYIIENYKDCYLFLIDSDMFFIDYFNIEKYMINYDLYGIGQSKGLIEYLWNGLFICNLSKCNNLEKFNWEAGRVYLLDDNNNKTENYIGCDVGGHNYYYLKKNGYLNANSNKLKKDGAMHIGLSNSIWIVGENGIKYLSDKLINILLEFSKLSSKPSNTEEGWINKELLLNNKIIHIRGGGGWTYHKESYHLDCVKLINYYIDNN
jgi:hypothetical protein